MLYLFAVKNNVAEMDLRVSSTKYTLILLMNKIFISLQDIFISIYSIRILVRVNFC